jgi:phage baseplate assembly protein W
MRHSAKMAGIDRITGKLRAGWEHVEQSISVLITTALGSRVMRRAVGSKLPRLVDAPMSPATLIDFYAATAGVIDRWEPRFRVVRMRVDGAAANGHLSLIAEGVYFPRGHLGDFTVQEPKNVSVPL